MTALEAELLRARSRVMTDVADSLRELVVRLPPGEVASDWRGPAQRAFEEALVVHLTRVRLIAASCDVASDALLGAAARLDVS